MTSPAPPLPAGAPRSRLSASLSAANKQLGECCGSEVLAFSWWCHPLTWQVFWVLVTKTTRGRFSVHTVYHGYLLLLVDVPGPSIYNCMVLVHGGVRS